MQNWRKTKNYKILTFWVLWIAFISKAKVSTNWNFFSRWFNKNYLKKTLEYIWLNIDDIKVSFPISYFFCYMNCAFSALDISCFNSSYSSPGHQICNVSGKQMVSNELFLTFYLIWKYYGNILLHSDEYFWK